MLKRLRALNAQRKRQNKHVFCLGCAQSIRNKHLDAHKAEHLERNEAFMLVRSHRHHITYENHAPVTPMVRDY